MSKDWQKGSGYASSDVKNTSRVESKGNGEADDSPQYPEHPEIPDCSLPEIS